MIGFAIGLYLGIGIGMVAMAVDLSRGWQLAWRIPVVIGGWPAVWIVSWPKSHKEGER
jgi:hypothetical protein